LLVLVFVCQIAVAQVYTITGKVIQKSSGIPLEKIKIAVTGSDSIAITDKDGQFKFEFEQKPERIQFEILSGGDLEGAELIDENDYILSVSKVRDYFNLPLEELLKQKVITAGRKSELVSEIPASVVVIGRKEIQSYGYRSLEEIFENIPGFYYANNYTFLGPTFGVRGYMTANPSNIIVLLNGVPQMNDYFNTFCFAHTPVSIEAIDRIEVIRGPMSVIYGSNAFFGAVNIITNKQVKKEQSHTIVSVGGGTQDAFQTQIYSKGESGKISYAINANFNKMGSIDKPFNEMVYNFDTKYASLGFLSPDAKSTDFFTNDQKYFNLSTKFGKFTLDLGYATTQYGHSILTLFYKPALMKSNYGKASLSYSTQFNERLSLKAKINYNRYDLYLGDNYFSLDTNGFGYASDLYSYGQYWSEKADGELHLFYKPANNLNITFGLAHSIITDAGDKTDAPFSSSPNLVANLLNRAGGLAPGSKVQTSSSYFQIAYNPFKKLSLVGGIRAEYMGSFDLVLYRGMYTPVKEQFNYTYNNPEVLLVPRLAAIWRLNDNNVIKLMYGEAMKNPDLWQLRNNMTNSTVTTLTPERIETYEINYLASWSLKYSLNLSVFFNDFDNLILRTIIFNSSTNPPVYNSYFTNSGRIETLGSELIFTANFSKNIRTEISATVQNSENKTVGFENIDVDFSPQFLFYLKGYFQLPFNLTLGFTANYVASMFAQYDNQAVNPDAGNYSPIGRYGDEVPAYFTINTNLRVNNLFHTGKNQNYGLYMDLKIKNLLDNEIRYAATSLSKWADKGVLGNGRNFFISLGYSF